MYYRDIEEVKERYDYDFRKWQHYSARWAELVSASVPKPNMQDLWEVLHVYSQVSDYKVQCNGVEFFARRFERARNDAKITISRHHRNDFPWLEPSSLEYHRYWGSSPQNVIQKAYGKARQWLKEVELSPPDPFRYKVVSRSPYKERVYHSASLGSLGIR